ncbi:MAG: 7-cyano-7-deazaguanine synthase QueC [Dehalococcoidia bacterium]|nr:7-cyano-7-deazaguanine synthase QueC [Dehalococcoidia bacterium]
MKKVGIILLSGGLDSTTVATYALKQGYDLTAITLHYGQRHTKELESARKVAEVLGIKQEVGDASFFKKLAWYSALTSSETFDIPKDRVEEQMANDVPITYVPLRNTFFITLAAAFLESEILALIENEGASLDELEAAVFIAANAIDYSGYPDCRPEYYQKLTDAIFAGSKLGTQYGKRMDILTPIISMTKAEIVKLGIELGAPLKYTWSCYEGGEIPCGECDSCILRAKGFAEAGYKDPLLVRFESESRIAKGS